MNKIKFCEYVDWIMEFVPEEYHSEIKRLTENKIEGAYKKKKENKY